MQEKESIRQEKYISHLIYLSVCFETQKHYSTIQFSSVQFSRSVLSDSLRPHELQHARPPYSSPSPRVHSDSCPSSQLLGYINAKFNWVIKGHCRFVSEAYLNNLSFNEVQMPHAWPATETGKRQFKKLSPTWMEGPFYQILLTQSCPVKLKGYWLPKTCKLDWSIKRPAELKLTLTMPKQRKLHYTGMRRWPQK